MHINNKAVPVVAVGGIVFKDNKVLLIKRGKPPREGAWSIPGGAVESGESLEHAVMRELMEETGLDVKPLCVVEVVEKIFRDSSGEEEFHYVILDYHCELRGGNLKASSDAADAGFFGIDELSSLRLDEKTIKVIEKANLLQKNANHRGLRAIKEKGRKNN